MGNAEYMGESIQINMGDPASDFASLVGPYSVAGGIYDFSGTQENHAYHEDQGPANGMKSAVTKAEIADWTRLWWDGQSDSWTTDAQFDATRKDKESKTGCVIAHSDYTVCAGVYDEEANQKDGALSLQMQQLMIAYKGSGF